MAHPRSYDAFAVGVYRALIDPLIEPLRRRIVQLCCELRVYEVLDIASATGAQCRRLAQAGLKATGLDLSEAMVAAARRQGGYNVHYIHGSAYGLPFEDGSFDASLLLLSLHEHPEKGRARMLGEALRVVRPDGYLIIADYNRPRLATIHIAWQLIRFIEMLAGAEHRAGFKDFIARGGLAGFLTRHALTPTYDGHSHGGTIGIAVVPRSRA